MLWAASQPVWISTGSFLAAGLALSTSNPTAGISLCSYLLLCVTQKRFWKSNIYLFHWGNFINQHQSLLALASDIMGSLNPANCE